VDILSGRRDYLFIIITEFGRQGIKFFHHSPNLAAILDKVIDNLLKGQLSGIA
jgi:hypothetical protein